MHYILDGNNIIKHPLWHSGQRIDERQALIISLADYNRNHPSVVFTVVFDGWSDISSSYPAIKVFWSGDVSADRIIIQKLQTIKQTAIVVSNDNEIRSGAKLKGFKVIKVEEFIKIIDDTVKVSIEKHPVNASDTPPSSQVLMIKKELKEYYEKNPLPPRIRKNRKRI